MDATDSLDDVAIFLEVVRAGSFARAAERRAVPRSTLSRTIDRLEKQLGCLLLQRSSRGLTVTPAGQQLVARAQPHLAGMRDALLSVSRDVEVPRGVLRLTAPGDMSDVFLAEVVASFCQRYPELRVEVDLSTRMVDLVSEGFDLAIRAGTVIPDSSLKARKLGSTQLQLFASPSYVARNGSPARPEELAGHRCVGFRARELRESWTMTSDRREVTVEIESSMGGNDFGFVRSALRAGAGIGKLPRIAGEVDIRDGRLVKVLPEWHMALGSVYLCYPAMERTPRKTTAFCEHMLEQVRSRPEWTLAFAQGSERSSPRGG